MPWEGIAFSKAKSYFTDVTFDTAETACIPKHWLEFANLPSPIDITTTMPDMTFFFMFYTQPSDRIQITSGPELNARGWNYDKNDWRSSKDAEGEQSDFDLHSWSIKSRTRSRQYTGSVGLLVIFMRILFDSGTLRAMAVCESEATPH
jgi:hypothetical protein